MPAKDYVIGVSLGKPNQYTAFLVIECIERPNEGPFYQGIKIERFTLGATYQEISARLKTVYDALLMEGIAEGEEWEWRDQHNTIIKKYPVRNAVKVVIERTHIGERVIELIKHSGVPIGREVFVTGSTKANKEEKTVPEQDIRDALVIVLQGKRFGFAGGPEAKARAEALAHQAGTFCSSVKKVPGTDDVLLRGGNDDEYMWAWSVAIWELEQRNRQVCVYPKGLLTAGKKYTGWWNGPFGLWRGR